MKILDLGLVGYGEALRVQKEILASRIQDKAEDTLIVLEHVPVISFGRLGSDRSIHDKEFFINKGIELVAAPRGGDITYHAPGQVVLYPVLSLKDRSRDISRYIDFLEKTVRNALMEMGVKAERDPAKRGVWVQGKKIAFIGVAFKKWTTYHGVAVNINNDITPFEHFDPCGESDIRVTSVEKEIGEVDLRNCKSILIDRFIKDFGIFYRGGNGNKITKTF